MIEITKNKNKIKNTNVAACRQQNCFITAVGPRCARSAG